MKTATFETNSVITFDGSLNELNQPIGKGTIYFPDGKTLSGNFEDGYLIGKGIEKFNADTILGSVKNNENIDKLINLLKKKLSMKYSSNNNILITRERHRIKLNEWLKEIDKLLKKDQNKQLELAAEDLRMATRHLGGIVGKVDVEEILGSIFKDFCIGK